MENQVIKKSRIRILLCLIFTFLTIYLTILETGHQLENELSDYYGHTFVYLTPFLLGYWKQAWGTAPYFLWHIVTLFFNRVLMADLKTSAALSSCVFAVLDFYIFEYVLRKAGRNLWGEEKNFISPVLAFSLCFVQGFYPGFMDAGQGYLGVFSMNPFHNPTQMCVRGISVLCFCLVTDILRYQKNENSQEIFFKPGKDGKGYYIALAALLLLSTLAKPTFAEMFIPAVGILMLSEYANGLLRKTIRPGEGLAKIGIMFACAVPALLSILLQFFAYFVEGGGNRRSGGVILTAPFEVWSSYSDNIALSILLGMAFPLAILLLDFPFFIKDSMGKLAMLGYLVGLSEAAFLGENGYNLLHGNFLWPMMSGMLLLWLAATLHLMGLEHSDFGKRKMRIRIPMAWALFAAHLFAGLLTVLQP